MKCNQEPTNKYDSFIMVFQFKLQGLNFILSKKQYFCLIEAEKSKRFDLFCISAQNETEIFFSLYKKWLKNGGRIDFNRVKVALL